MGALAHIMPRFTSAARQAALVRMDQVMSGSRTRSERTVRTMEQPAVLHVEEISKFAVGRRESREGQVHVSSSHQDAKKEFGVTTDVQVSKEE